MKSAKNQNKSYTGIILFVAICAIVYLLYSYIFRSSTSEHFSDSSSSLQRASSQHLYEINPFPSHNLPDLLHKTYSCSTYYCHILQLMQFLQNKAIENDMLLIDPKWRQAFERIENCKSPIPHRLKINNNPFAHLPQTEQHQLQNLWVSVTIYDAWVNKLFDQFAIHVAFYVEKSNLQQSVVFIKSLLYHRHEPIHIYIGTNSIDLPMVVKQVSAIMVPYVKLSVIDMNDYVLGSSNTILKYFKTENPCFAKGSAALFPILLHRLLPNSVNRVLLWNSHISTVIKQNLKDLWLLGDHLSLNQIFASHPKFSELIYINLVNIRKLGVKEFDSWIENTWEHMKRVHSNAGICEKMEKHFYILLEMIQRYPYANLNIEEECKLEKSTISKSVCQFNPHFWESEKSNPTSYVKLEPFYIRVSKEQLMECPILK